MNTMTQWTVLLTGINILCVAIIMLTRWLNKRPVPDVVLRRGAYSCLGSHAVELAYMLSLAEGLALRDRSVWCGWVADAFEDYLTGNVSADIVIDELLVAVRERKAGDAASPQTTGE